MSEWTELLLAFYQTVASSSFHNLNAIFVTDSLDPIALLLFLFTAKQSSSLFTPGFFTLPLQFPYLKGWSFSLLFRQSQKIAPFFFTNSQSSQNHFLCITYQSAQRWAGSLLSAHQHQVGSSPGKYMSHCHRTAASKGWWRHHNAEGSHPSPPDPWNALSWAWRDPHDSRIPREEKWQKALLSAWANVAEMMGAEEKHQPASLPHLQLSCKNLLFSLSSVV